MTSDTSDKLNPRTSHAHLEFGGVMGTSLLYFLLPFVILSLCIFCTESFCFETLDIPRAIQAIPTSISFYYSTDVLLVLLGWFVFVFLLERILPGEHVLGLKMRNGAQLPYKINGHLTFWAVILVADHWHQLGITKTTLSWAFDHYLHLAVASMLVSFVLSAYLYVRSFHRGALLALGGNSGMPMYDAFMGRELNPRWGVLDIKEFVEMRLGLLGWLVLNLSLLTKQYESRGYVSSEILLVVFFQLVYVWDALYHEKSFLSTMDVTTDGLGFMLVFGNLVWVPFGFSVQARYLVSHDPHLSPWFLLFVVCLNFSGYLLFRGANGQKDKFRTDRTHPDVAHLKYMETKRGTPLLISGFWGMARKINYTADLMMALSWCLPCGFGSILPFFYFIYLFSLLMHRAIRDDAACAEKYGDDWKTYKKKVPKMFIPWII